jgi:hypothetical protein
MFAERSVTLTRTVDAKGEPFPCVTFVTPSGRTVSVDLQLLSMSNDPVSLLDEEAAAHDQL